MNYSARLFNRISDKTAIVGVVGLGYVGLPVAVAFAEAGFRVFGFDVDSERVRKLSRGISYIDDVSTPVLRRLVLKKRRMEAHTRFNLLRKVDCAVICVPTPLAKSKTPDMSFIVEAAKTAGRFIRKGALISLESTTYPGTTQEEVLPILSAGGRKAGRDFFLCFSPERIDPGNKRCPFREIPKVVGGVTATCTRVGQALYRTIVNRVVPVSSPACAEMSKQIENTFRIVNIGLINELAMISRRLGVNIWEAIEAAKTKPFGYLPFYPGPGVGGHCIGVDPIYLSWKAKVLDSEVRLIDLAAQINTGMPDYVVRRAVEELNKAGRSVKGSKVLILGMSYKKDVNDLRESPAIEILEGLENLGAQVSYHDPHVPTFRWKNKKYASKPLTPKELSRNHLILIVTDHSDVDYRLVARRSKRVLDTRNALHRFRAAGHIVTL